MSYDVSRREFLKKSGVVADTAAASLSIAWDAKPRSLPGKDGRYPFPIPGVYSAY